MEKRLACPNCKSGKVHATGSEQERGDGQRYADMICDNCGKSFWDSSTEAVAASREVDRNRARQQEEHDRIRK